MRGNANKDAGIMYRDPLELDYKIKILQEDFHSPHLYMFAERWTLI